MITVLADTAIRGHDLDEAKALEAQKRAHEAMQNRTSQMEYAKARRRAGRGVRRSSRRSAS